MLIDAHIHIERGPYELSWIEKFIETALSRKIDHIFLLEHSHRFIEFKPIYKPIIKHKKYGEYQRKWLENRNIMTIKNYNIFIKQMKKKSFPLNISWGLEVCYFSEMETEIKDILKINNVDIKREAIRKFGPDTFYHKLGGKKLDRKILYIDSDHAVYLRPGPGRKSVEYELLDVDIGVRTTFHLLKMQNPSLDNTWLLVHYQKETTSFGGGPHIPNHNDHKGFAFFILLILKKPPALQVVFYFPGLY